MKRTLSVVLLMGLLACGAPRGPVALPAEDIPFPVRRSIEPANPGQVTKSYVVSFVRRARLVAVRRELSTRFPDVEVVTRALLDGPNAREHARGIRTEIPDDTRLLTVRVADRVAGVNLTNEFQNPGPSQSVLLRVAQVVRTLVLLDGVDAVRFSVNGEAISVPTDEGPVQRPVTVLDYASVMPARRR